MPLTMYQLSVPVFARSLTALLGLLRRAEAYAEAKKLDEAGLLGTRLYPDMYPFSVQVGQACLHAARAVSQLSGMPAPEFSQPETTFAGLRARVRKTLDFINAATPAQIDGTEDKELMVKLGKAERPFRGEQFLIGFTMPNFYFHYTTAYNILRGHGMEIGKRDFMGAPLQV